MSQPLMSRPLTLSDLKQARELWSLAFPDDNEAFKDWFFADQFPSLRSWSVWEKDRLVAVVYAMSYTLACRGRTVPAALILGVATHPQARRRGLMRGLMREVHEDLARSCAAVCLHPFDFDFYRKLGYSVVADRLRVRLPAREPPTQALSQYDPRGSVELSPDFEKLAAINRRHAGRSGVAAGFSAVRDSSLLARRFADLQTGGGFCMMNEQAYAFVDADPSGVFLFPEFSYEDFAAGCSLLAALARSFDVSLFDFSLAVNDADNAPAWWPPESMTREPFLMMCGLDWPALVTGMRTSLSASSSSPSGIIHISDDNSCWRITTSDGTASLSATDCSQSQSDVSLSRDQFIRWVCGCSNAEAPVAGKTGAECLEGFPGLSAFFFDMY